MSFIIQKDAASRLSLIPIQPCGCKLPLFGIHVLGKGMKFYRPLAKYLGLEQPVYGLTVQMCTAKNQLNNIETLAAHYIRQMQTLQPEGPYYLVGVSLGGIVAFEMAQQLYAQGNPVALLGMLDAFVPPRAMQRLPLHSRLSNLWNSVPRLEKDVWGKIEIGFWNWSLQHTAFEVGCRWFYKICNRPFPDKLQDIVYIQQNLQIASIYVPQIYPNRIVVFQAQDQKVSAAFASDPRLEWKYFAAGGIEVHEIPGTHLEILQDPQVRVVAEKLKLYLD